MKTHESKQIALSLRQTSRDTEAGFTLMETSIGLVLMMIVGLSAASLFSYAIGNNLRGSDRVESLAVAQEQMEQLRKTSFSNLATRVTELGGADRTMTREGRQFRVVTTMADTVSGDTTLKTVTVQAARLGPRANGPTPTLRTHKATNSLGAYLVP